MRGMGTPAYDKGSVGQITVGLRADNSMACLYAMSKRVEMRKRARALPGVDWPERGAATLFQANSA